MLLAYHKSLFDPKTKLSKKQSVNNNKNFKGGESSSQFRWFTIVKTEL